MRIGIDLLWVRPGKCGGTESFIRNLLEGFLEYDKENEYILLTAKNNARSFRKYTKKPMMKLKICNVTSSNRMNRVLWENIHLDGIAASCGVDVLFIPMYNKPLKHGSGIPYVNVIHDIQVMHYPENFSWVRRTFQRYAYWNTCRTTDRLITISDFCKKDLIRHFPFVKNKIEMIYIPIITKESQLNFHIIEKKYPIQKGRYYYCVSSMTPHKNLSTILKIMTREKEMKLVISGVGGREEQVKKIIRELQIEERIVLTGYVSDEERDCLYENCSLFLFPSVFEGFGMPPIEAMRKGKRVVMTRKTCLEEVTQKRAVYVENPYSVEEWRKKIAFARTLPEEKTLFREYDMPAIIERYIKVLTAAAGCTPASGKDCGTDYKRRDCFGIHTGR